MTSSPGAPGRHAAPSPRDEDFSDWLSAPAEVGPHAGLPSGLSGARSGSWSTLAGEHGEPADDWSALVPGLAFDDAFALYTSQTAPRPPRAPSHAAPAPEAAPELAPEPDAWPAMDLTPDPPAWEPSREEWDRPARSHRRHDDHVSALESRPRPLVFGLAGLVVGLALSVVAIMVVGAAFPSLLPSL